METISEIDFDLSEKSSQLSQSEDGSDEASFPEEELVMNPNAALEEVSVRVVKLRSLPPRR